MGVGGNKRPAGVVVAIVCVQTFAQIFRLMLHYGHFKVKSKAVHARIAWLILCAAALLLRAEPPANYYDAARGLAGGALSNALHQIIRNHIVIPYSSSSQTDTSDALRILDQDPSNPNNVWLLYAQSSLPKSALGTGDGYWDREHRWPKSYGFGTQEPAYSDLHNLHAENSNVNSARGNKYYDNADSRVAGYANPADPEAPLCKSDFDSWEPPPNTKGDLARAQFYMVIRYNGDTNNEPRLLLTDQTNRIAIGSNYMGRLSTLIAWHKADPPDATEKARNDRIYSLYQRNRNPFVDHPEWVDLIFSPPFTNAPRLGFSRMSNGLLLSWTATNQMARLQVRSPENGGWVDVPALPELTNGQFRLLYTNAAQTRAWFRLRVIP